MRYKTTAVIHDRDFILSDADASRLAIDQPGFNDRIISIEIWQRVRLLVHKFPISINAAGYNITMSTV